MTNEQREKNLEIYIKKLNQVGVDTSLLMEKYDRHPVHSLDEILLLHSRFPENIKLYTAMLGDEILAGVVM